ncbi:PqqD family peptide modification chaperone [Krasilnikovia sp. MM14-A1259]|uniref:PqqD family peptide modification chaperone n=1 Tax=Krasilnikovia sp. MM14-A1259 TaxID=3373539 RepID=UPI0037FE4562
MRLLAARTTAAAGPDAVADRRWLDTEPLCLRETVQRLEGADGRPMLFDVATGRYVAISKAGAAIVALLNGTSTGSALVERIVARASGDPANAEAAVVRFLSELRQAGVLSTDPPGPKRPRSARFMRRHTPRLPLTRSLLLVLEPLARRLRQIPRFLLATVMITVLGGAASLAGLALSSQPFGLHYTHWIWAAVAILVAQIAVHEVGHAIVCQYLGVPVREAGITLMLFVMPVAYVDRTDAYRIRSRGSRTLIALAGPLSDVLWAGATSLVILTTHGVAAHIATQLLQMQVLLMIVNLNPLLPSDGYHALESAFGAINLRGRAFSYLAHLVSRSELPSYLRILGRVRRFGYLAFGVVCLSYGALTACLILLSWWRLLLSAVA